jgi:4-hydroxymandelate oxidase
MSADLSTRFLALADFEPAARACLPHALYEYIASAAGDEITRRENEAAFDRLKLRPRVLRDVSKIDTRVKLFGETFAHPVLLAPTAYQRMWHPEGEIATSRGAGEAGAVFILSTSGTASIEECVASSAAPVWFLLYWQSDRAFNESLVARVGASGARALCVTVDTPVLGDRRRQYRTGFELPPDMATPHLHDRNSGLRGVATPQRAILTWRDIEWIRARTKLPLVLKGILDPDDAAQAIEVGAGAIMVSNHGARNLDTLPATIEALPAVAERVAGRIPILIDGGIRRGTDVLKSLALGATAVLIGRPYVYALAVAGAAGVTHCVDLLRRELAMGMALTGRTTLAEIDRSLIW